MPLLEPQKLYLLFQNIKGVATCALSKHVRDTFVQKQSRKPGQGKKRSLKRRNLIPYIIPFYPLSHKFFQTKWAVFSIFFIMLPDKRGNVNKSPSWKGLWRRVMVDFENCAYFRKISSYALLLTIFNRNFLHQYFKVRFWKWNIKDWNIYLFGRWLLHSLVSSCMRTYCLQGYRFHCFHMDSQDDTDQFLK